MKINIKELINALNKINHINYQFVKITFKDKKIILKTFNNYVKIQITISEENVNKNFSIIVNSRILNNLFSKITDKNIDIEKDNDSLTISYDQSKMTLNGYKNEQFDDFNLQLTNDYKKTHLTYEDLFLINKYVQPYVLDEQTETNKKLVGINCINIVSINNDLKVFATDMKRLVSYTLKKVQNENINYLIYNRTFNQILKCLNSNEKNNLEIFNDVNKMLFKTKDMLLEINLVTFIFPNLQKIANDEQKNLFKLNVNDLIMKLERGNIISSNNMNSLVYFSFQNDKILLSFRNSEQGYASELIDYENLNGEISNFSISIDFLLTALKNISDTNVYFSINDNLSPLFVYDHKNKNLLQVILPTKNIF